MNDEASLILIIFISIVIALTVIIPFYYYSKRAFKKIRNEQKRIVTKLVEIETRTSRVEKELTNIDSALITIKETVATKPYLFDEVDPNDPQLPQM